MAKKKCFLYAPLPHRARVNRLVRLDLPCSLLGGRWLSYPSWTECTCSLGPSLPSGLCPVGQLPSPLPTPGQVAMFFCLPARTRPAKGTCVLAARHGCRLPTPCSTQPSFPLCEGPLKGARAPLHPHIMQWPHCSPRTGNVLCTTPHPLHLETNTRVSLLNGISAKAALFGIAGPQRAASMSTSR